MGLVASYGEHFLSNPCFIEHIMPPVTFHRADVYALVFAHCLCAYFYYLADTSKLFLLSRCIYTSKFSWTHSNHLWCGRRNLHKKISE